MILTTTLLVAIHGRINKNFFPAKTEIFTTMVLKDYDMNN